jgi:DNA-binding IclR family transcriptional regulator
MRMLHNVQHFPELGCCLSLGEVLPDVQAVAVPLGRIDRGEPAALNFSVQGRKIDQDWLLRDIAPRLQALARELT